MVKDSNYRRLVTALAPLLQAEYSFSEIADLLYRGGVIDSPKNPYPEYYGNKADYAKEMLSDAGDVRSLLYDIVPEIYFKHETEYSQNSAADFIYATARLGYRVEEVYEEDVSYRELVPPEKFGFLEDVGPTLISIGSGAPEPVDNLMIQLNSSVGLRHWDGAALLVRQILFIASVIYSKQKSFHPVLLAKNGDYKELSQILGTISEHVPDLSTQLISRIRIAKWSGDNANHMAEWRASEREVEQAVSSLDAFIRILFPR